MTEASPPRIKLERDLLWVVALCAVLPAGSLAIVSASPEALVPIGGLRVALPLAILLSLCLLSLLSIRRVHQRLVPLETLREGTRRIAEARDHEPIQIQSGDEFEELASLVNTIAGRLGAQVQTLSTMIDVDRSIHASIDSNAIVDTVLTRIREVFPCDAVSVSLVQAGDDADLSTWLSSDDERRAQQSDSSAFSARDVRQLRSQPETIVIDAGERVPRYLAPLAAAGAQRILVLPLFAREEILGAIALGHRDARPSREDRVVYARQLADHVAIALGNARVLDENRFLAFYDSLTGLPNRRMYRDRLNRALGHARRRRQILATCYVDLDGFKRINETLGHEVGDRLLREVAERLTRCVRVNDAVARSDAEAPEAEISRLGGDEFTILVTEISEAQDASRVARRVLEGLAAPYVIDGREMVVTGSMGIAVYPFDGEDVDTLLRNADTAMYCAKGRGRNNYQFYARSMNAEASRRLHLETRLRQAIDRDEITIHYQPLIYAASGELAGTEALLRWDDPDMGIVYPNEFIPVAEETGLIISLGDWVLRGACAQFQAWRAAGLALPRMAVNLSGLQLRQPRMVETVAQVLEETGVDPSCLELEITESTIMQDDDITSATLGELRDMGIGLALDDFGTGYSSLSYLRRFPLTRVKIDRSFVKEIPGDASDSALTAAVINMAHSLGLRVVAEGVETEEQAEFLREMGCDELQGFLFSPAVPSDALGALVSKGWGA
jgi:diguanylate cyclase (GGDEF)-like protein